MWGFVWVCFALEYCLRVDGCLVLGRSFARLDQRLNVGKNVQQNMEFLVVRRF
ncbi:hypothetical protein KC19_8G064700 [Ceratodon purpureus]|uniref:Uncharacterized protein n=1 Tax=Ceratodon purpureus TaxID=3225 RepID=A0A8T0GYA3_CERPU|nr:hypothetical protein KC19_8G064700 [Ceratodon purpureus]